MYIRYTINFLIDCHILILIAYRKKINEFFRSREYKLHCCTPLYTDTQSNFPLGKEHNDDSFSSQHLEFQKQSFRHSAREQNTIQIWSLHRLFERIARREDERVSQKTRPQTSQYEFFTEKTNTIVASSLQTWKFPIFRFDLLFPSYHTTHMPRDMLRTSWK